MTLTATEDIKVQALNNTAVIIKSATNARFVTFKESQKQKNVQNEANGD